MIRHPPARLRGGSGRARRSWSWRRPSQRTGSRFVIIVQESPWQVSEEESNGSDESDQGSSNSESGGSGGKVDERQKLNGRQSEGNSGRHGGRNSGRSNGRRSGRRSRIASRERTTTSARELRRNNNGDISEQSVHDIAIGSWSPPQNKSRNGGRSGRDGRGNITMWEDSKSRLGSVNQDELLMFNKLVIKGKISIAITLLSKIITV